MAQNTPLPDELAEAIEVYNSGEIVTQKRLETGDLWLEVKGHVKLQAYKLENWQLFTSSAGTSGKTDWTFSKAE